MTPESHAPAAVRSSCLLVDLDGRTVASLSGPDARRFANGMFTNNVRDLPVGGAQRSAMVDDRGRMVGLMELYCVGPDRFLAVLEGVDWTSFHERYERYVVFDDVELEDVSGQWCLSTLQGRTAAQALTSVGIDLPSEGRFHDHRRGLVMPRDRSGLGGYDLLIRSEHAAELREALAAMSSPRPEGALEVLRVSATKARWPVDMPERCLVHEAGLRDEVLHFEKGCYIGQETINRVDVMGKVKRRLVGLVIHGDTLPEHGAEVRHGDKVVGALTSPVRAGSGEVRALAVLRQPAHQPGTEVVLSDGLTAAVAAVE